MMMSFPLLWHHMLDGSTCEFCPKSYRCPHLDYWLWTMDPLDRARALVKLLPDLVPEAKEGDKIYELGALCPEVFTQTNCKESMAANWEYIDPIYNRFLGLQFSVEV